MDLLREVKQLDVYIWKKKVFCKENVKDFHVLKINIIIRN